jgi:Lar family restriction alleviation protein
MNEPKKVIVSEKLKAFLASLPDDNNCCVGSTPLEEPEPATTPCPFCGGSNTHVAASDDCIAYCVTCGDCNADGPLLTYDGKMTVTESHDAAVAMWNQREGAKP